MRVIIRYPQRREHEVKGQRRVQDVLKELRFNPESVLVLRDDALLTRDVFLREEDTIEIIPAISGG